MSSDPRYLSVVRAAVGELSAACGLAEDSCHGVVLAVDEALANVICHAYKNQPDGEIEVDCEAGPNELVFRLLDHGEPVDPARICGRPLDNISLNGRGTYLIKAMMDEVIYERIEGTNQVRMIKRLSVPDGAVVKHETTGTEPAGGNSSSA
jgi:anti-sigma regulatory factor (Ser/Thr protein kinase)